MSGTTVLREPLSETGGIRHSRTAGRRPWRRSRARRGLSAPPQGLLPLVLLLVIWQLAGDQDSLSFPPPSEWSKALTRLNDEDVLGAAINTTLVTFVLSFIVAVLVGMTLGLAIGSSRFWTRTTGPILDFMRSVPPPVIIPIGSLLLGFSTTMAVATVAVSVVWPVLLGTLSARRTMPTPRLEMGVVLGLSWYERAFKIVLPSVLPGAYAGIKLSIAYSLVTTLLVDILGSAAGIGRLIVESQQQFDAAAVWGLLALVGAFGYLLNIVLVWSETRLLKNFGPAQ